MRVRAALEWAFASAAAATAAAFTGTAGVVHRAAGDFDRDGRDDLVYAAFRGVRVLALAPRGEGT